MAVYGNLILENNATLSLIEESRQFDLFLNEFNLQIVEESFSFKTIKDKIIEL